jgi:hypothetical protein
MAEYVLKSWSWLQVIVVSYTQSIESARNGTKDQFRIVFCLAWRVR